MDNFLEIFTNVHRGNDSPLRVVDHVGIAVPNLDEAVASYKEHLGIESVLREVVASQGVEIANLHCANLDIELIAPAVPTNPIAGFIERRGGGLHHIAFGVPDIELSLLWCRDNDISLIDEVPRIGAMGRKVAFCKPKQFLGVLVELCEIAPYHLGKDAQ